ncbi:MAG: response regulator transcription factor [Bacteroidales bacterium]|jgi:DNA-binding NarL/FixJ family response regulator|nr:response regulator transcription factor [Bacteroidales bacterium]
MHRILIVDDHPLLAEGIQSLLKEYRLSEEPGIASSAAECRKLLRSSSFDLVLLDINLPDASGIDLCKEIMENCPGIRILAITSFSEFSCVSRMMANGASGYVLKNAMPEEIIKGIETVMKGEIFLCHDVDILMNKNTEKHIFLTRRESELLRLITEGYTNQEIADKLYLGNETIKSYRKNLLFKLNVKNTASLVRYAIEQKLV